MVGRGSCTLPRLCVCVCACAYVYVCVAVRGTRGTLYEWNVSTPSVAREAPVCPACKHNNTDVSIHQVDPGGVERPREMPLEAPREPCVRPRVCIVLFLSFSCLFFFFTPSPTLYGYLKDDSDLDRTESTSIHLFVPRICFRIRESRGRLCCAIWCSLKFLRFQYRNQKRNSTINGRAVRNVRVSTNVTGIACAGN